MLQPLLESQHIEDFLLVTSPSHMRRSVGAFVAQGLDPIPAPSVQHPDGFLEDKFLLMPNRDALEASRMAMRETMALGYYAIRGWLSSP